MKDAYMFLHQYLCAEVGNRKADHYMDMVRTVCCEYERVSFIEGVLVGARLMIELFGEV